jgi:hypothetical protein
VEPFNSTAVTVQWRPHADAEQNGIIRGYRVHYVQLSGHDVDDISETLMPTNPQHAARSVDVPDASRYEIVVSGLQPDTAYQFQVKLLAREGKCQINIAIWSIQLMNCRNSWYKSYFRIDYDIQQFFS